MKIYIDGHCDTLTSSYDDKGSIQDRKYCFNITDAKGILCQNERIPAIQFMATFIDPKFENGFQRAIDVIDYYLKNKKDEVLIKNKLDVYNVLNDKSVGIFLTIENGKAIENKIENVDTLYDKGVRLMSVNWNEDNLLGTGALTTKKTGLTELGKQYVKKLEEKNIIIDISHSSERTFWDVINNTNKTVVATHSCCYNMCNHPRNLKDDQIKAIASRNGIIGICLCSSFLRENGSANVNDIVRHIDYIIHLVGEDYAGLGTDFDGVTKAHQLSDIHRLNEIGILVQHLKTNGYKQETINKIMGENWLRVLEKNL